MKPKEFKLYHKKHISPYYHNHCKPEHQPAVKHYHFHVCNKYDCNNRGKCNNKNNNMRCESCGSYNINIDYHQNSYCCEDNITYIVTCNCCHLTRQYTKPKSDFNFRCIDPNNIYKHFCTFEQFKEYPNCDNFAALHIPRTDIY